jgi:hypothetical protein
MDEKLLPVHSWGFDEATSQMVFALGDGRRVRVFGVIELPATEDVG